MNLPNKLSVARVLCIPAIVTLLHFPSDTCRIIAAVLFIIGCLTDFLDGKIARKRNLVTDFGKFIDPVAMLVYLKMMPAWIVIIILCRELAVDGLRMVAVTKGNVIAAGPLGKWKTACQMILISAMLILNLSVYECWPLAVLAGIVVLLTLGSAVDYFVRNASVLSEK